MRVAFTIILNGLHHLKHNDMAEKLVDAVDYWQIVEGAASPTGSTSWCRTVKPSYRDADGMSTDGTNDYLNDLVRRYPDRVGHSGTVGKNKDQMVNCAIEGILKSFGNKIPDDCYLYQIDVDEQWDKEQMDQAEAMLEYMRGDCGKFLCDYYVGSGLLAKGDWGEGRKIPYRRLWKWRGQKFQTHEPPELEGGNGVEILLPQRFKHYAYYFPEDVKFKESFYTGHDGAYARWCDLQEETAFPQPLTRLITGPWGRTNTVIVRENDD